LRKRAATGDVFNTVDDEEFLRKVGVEARPGSPFLHFCFDEPVHYVGRTPNKRPFVRRQSASDESRQSGSSKDQFAHDWAKVELFRFGGRLGEEPKMEHAICQGRRVDVTWAKSRIAWEIDLSPQAQLDHDLRVHRTESADYRMISLIDMKDKNLSNAEHPRLRFRDLRSAKHFEMRHRWKWTKTFVGGVWILSKDEPLEWAEPDEFNFRDFCQALLRNEIEWQSLGERPCRKPSTRPRRRVSSYHHAKRKPRRFDQYAWIRKDDYSKHLVDVKRQEELARRARTEEIQRAYEEELARFASPRSEEEPATASRLSAEAKAQMVARSALVMTPRLSFWQRLARVLFPWA
jgi:hypothetical protein